MAKVAEFGHVWLNEEEVEKLHEAINKIFTKELIKDLGEEIGIPQGKVEPRLVTVYLDAVDDEGHKVSDDVYQIDLEY